jgi:predicted DNA-binding antitoxin AbrB/MazE fold protein
MGAFEAIYEGGVFRPIEPIMLPEKSRVKLELCVENGTVSKDGDDGLDAIYEILDRRYNSGHTDTAARHNEHQP